jgi:phosphoribosylformylglycinamidine synthase subunit PurQ / glutaminase
MSQPSALVIAAPGTNRDIAAARALEAAGATAQIRQVAELLKQPGLIEAAQMIVIAGGFSHADALGAGRLLALELTHGDGGRVGEALRNHVERQRPLLGICNGFQVLTRMGFLEGALAHNSSGDFVCGWVDLELPVSNCVWTAGIDEPLSCVIAHGEGRFVHSDPQDLVDRGHIALRYRGDNPNGSMLAIAGITDPSGVVLGMMPHPEDHYLTRQHPQGLTRTSDPTLGLAVFSAGVTYARGL